MGNFRYLSVSLCTATTRRWDQQQFLRRRDGNRRQKALEPRSCRCRCWATRRHHPPASKTPTVLALAARSRWQRRRESAASRRPRSPTDGGRRPSRSRCPSIAARTAADWSRRRPAGADVAGRRRKRRACRPAASCGPHSPPTQNRFRPKISTRETPMRCACRCRRRRPVIHCVSLSALRYLCRQARRHWTRRVPLSPCDTARFLQRLPSVLTSAMFSNPTSLPPPPCRGSAIWSDYSQYYPAALQLTAVTSHPPYRSSPRRPPLVSPSRDSTRETSSAVFPQPATWMPRWDRRTRCPLPVWRWARVPCDSTGTDRAVWRCSGSRWADTTTTTRPSRRSPPPSLAASGRRRSLLLPNKRARLLTDDCIHAVSDHTALFIIDIISIY